MKNSRTCNTRHSRGSGQLWEHAQHPALSSWPSSLGQPDHILKDFVSSVWSSSGYHGLLHIRKQPTFSDFSNIQIYKVLKRPYMCYIFEKHAIQGYQIRHSRVSNEKYTNTKIHKYKVLKRPNCDTIGCTVVGQ